ncbi:MAG TPA: hypothetical protein ENK08_01015, partial [Chloroflexi bacterium]|nr:hypothetical protein [Chloroflexota bacterium]
MERRRKRWLVPVIVVLAGCLLACIVGGGVYLLRYSPLLQRVLQGPSPVVRFLVPTHGDEVVVGSTVAVEVEAAAPGGQVSLLQLWADDLLVGEMPAAAEAASGSWGWVPLSPGDHTLVARAFNEAGSEGVAVVRVRAVEAADGDRDGVADEADACPDQPGLLQLDGCPPGMADGLPPSDPEMQEIVERWVPPEVGGEQLGEASFPEEGAPSEGEAPAGEEAPPEEEASPEGAEGEAGGGFPAWPDQGFPPGDWAVRGNCPLCPWLEGLLERDAEGGEVFTDEEMSGTAVEVEVNELRTAQGWSGVYCYVRLAGEDWTAVPDSQRSLWPTGMPGFWDVGAVLGGEHGRVVTLSEGEPLRLEMECLGRTEDPAAEPQYLGHLVREHGPADWNGQPIVARAEAGGNWFEITYRLCGGACEEEAIPAPYALRLRTEEVGGTTAYVLSWGWRGDRERIDGFNVYVCYTNSGNCFQVEQTTVQGVLLDESLAVPPCGRTHRFEVRAFRRTEDGVEESAPSPPAWASSPAVCRGVNRLAIRETRGPTRYRAMMLVDLEYRYVGDHGDRVTIFAYPLKDGEPDPSFFWRGTTVYGGAEDGEITVGIYYAGTERHTTDGLRLVMVS